MGDSKQFKEKAKATIETLADVSVETYKQAEERARVLAKKTKLRAGIVNDKATIRRLNVELGSKYYNMFKDDPAPEFEQLCLDITAAFERIADKEKQVEELKKAAGAADSADTCADENDNSTDEDSAQD